MPIGVVDLVEVHAQDEGRVDRVVPFAGAVMTTLRAPAVEMTRRVGAGPEEAGGPITRSTPRSPQGSAAGSASEKTGTQSRRS